MRARFEMRVKALVDFAVRAKNYTEMTQTGTLRAIPPRHVELFQSLTLLQIVSEWECFLEETFARHLLGAKTRNGYSPKIDMLVKAILMVARPHSIAEAKRLMLAYERRPKYLSWSAPDAQRRAERFFENGEPYDSLGPIQQHFVDMLNLRNCFAHRSGYSKSVFEDILRREYSPMPRGMTVGRLLMKPYSQIPSMTWLDRFVSWTIFASKRIVP